MEGRIGLAALARSPSKRPVLVVVPVVVANRALDARWLQRLEVLRQSVNGGDDADEKVESDAIAGLYAHVDRFATDARDA